MQFQEKLKQLFQLMQSKEKELIELKTKVCENLKKEFSKKDSELRIYCTRK